MKYLVLLGRIFFSALFILAALNHFNAHQIAYAANEGVPFPAIFVPLSGLIALVGGLSVLLGFKARFGAWLLVIFLIPVTLMMHRFWAANDPIMTSIQEAMFMKNLALLGAALLITHFGSGPLSVDKK